MFQSRKTLLLNQTDAGDAVVHKVQDLKFRSCLQPSDPEYAATEPCIATAEGETPFDFMLDIHAEV